MRSLQLAGRHASRNEMESSDRYKECRMVGQRDVRVLDARQQKEDTSPDLTDCPGCSIYEKKRKQGGMGDDDRVAGVGGGVVDGGKILFWACSVVLHGFWV